MDLYEPAGTHIGDDVDPHGNGFSLLAYTDIDDDTQGAICLIPSSHRAPWLPQPDAGSEPVTSVDANGAWAGNYLTYTWNGSGFDDVQAHWNIVDAVNRYRDDFAGDI